MKSIHLLWPHTELLQTRRYRRLWPRTELLFTRRYRRLCPRTGVFDCTVHGLIYNVKKKEKRWIHHILTRIRLIGLTAHGLINWKPSVIFKIMLRVCCHHAAGGGSSSVDDYIKRHQTSNFVPKMRIIFHLVSIAFVQAGKWRVQ